MIALLTYYGVPLIITTDDGVIAATTADQVAAVIQSQLDALRGVGYHHSDISGYRRIRRPTVFGVGSLGPRRIAARESTVAR
jgi:hypothetical protein